MQLCVSSLYNHPIVLSIFMLWAIPISSFILKKWLFHLFPLFFSSSDAPAFSYYGQSDMHWVDNELVHHWLEQAQCTLEASFCNKMELGHRNTSIVHKQLLASQTHRHCESFSVSFEAFCSGSHEIWPLPSLYIYILYRNPLFSWQGRLTSFANCA